MTGGSLGLFGTCLNREGKRFLVDQPEGPVPQGFDTFDHFAAFASRLRAGLPDAVQPLFQGSSVTGVNRAGEPFDAGRRSDFDIALVGPALFDAGRSMGLKAKDGTRIGPLSPQVLEALGLLGLRDELSTLAGRPVNFMLFSSLDAALKRPSLWVP